VFIFTVNDMYDFKEWFISVVVDVSQLLPNH